jgi:hypothetical protein
MNNDEMLDEDLLMCGECELVVMSEDELLPYEEMHVCINCYDQLKLADEHEVQEWETEGYDYE